MDTRLVNSDFARVEWSLIFIAYDEVDNFCIPYHFFKMKLITSLMSAPSTSPSPLASYL